METWAWGNEAWNMKHDNIAYEAWSMKNINMKHEAYEAWRKHVTWTWKHETWSMAMTYETWSIEIMKHETWNGTWQQAHGRIRMKWRAWKHETWNMHGMKWAGRMTWDKKHEEWAWSMKHGNMRLWGSTEKTSKRMKRHEHQTWAWHGTWYKTWSMKNETWNMETWRHGSIKHGNIRNGTWHEAVNLWKNEGKMETWKHGSIWHGSMKHETDMTCVTMKHGSLWRMETCLWSLWNYETWNAWHL
jgi:hypothetical protein